MKKEDFLKLLISIAIPLLAGFIGSYFTTPNIAGWYAELTKPALNPPNWIFAPVWTTLYIMIGFALFLVWKNVNFREKRAIVVSLFLTQLLLNTTWSIVFFGMQNPGLALVNIALLWVAILGTIFVFNQISKPAALLLVPYILWVSFASYLNYAIWALN